MGFNLKNIKKGKKSIDNKKKQVQKIMKDMLVML